MIGEIATPPNSGSQSRTALSRAKDASSEWSGNLSKSSVRVRRLLKTPGCQPYF